MYPYFKAHSHAVRMLLFIVVVGLSGIIISARWKQNESNPLRPMQAISESATVVNSQRQRNMLAG